MNSAQQVSKPTGGHDMGMMNMRRYTGGMVMVVVAALGASGCGTFGPTDGGACEHSAEAGTLALVPTVMVDGLEKLANRSHGSVVLDEVLLNVDDIAADTTDGRALDVLSDDHFLLRYSPAAGAAGLTPLYLPADEVLSGLGLDVAPRHASVEELAQESLDRGFNMLDLAGASVVIRGKVATSTIRSATASHDLEGGADCDETSGAGCEGTVPDTSPADGQGGTGPSPIKVDNGTVPDTSPAKGEVAMVRTGETSLVTGMVMPRREYRRFTVVVSTSFNLYSQLDMDAVRDGGAIQLVLDANKLFSDRNLASLEHAAEVQPRGEVMTRFGGESLGGALRISAADVATARPSVAPR